MGDPPPLLGLMTKPLSFNRLLPLLAVFNFELKVANLETDSGMLSIDSSSIPFRVSCGVREGWVHI